MEQLGADRLAEFDEIILMNSTFFGPVGTFDDLFADMSSRDVDFWGITEHGFAETHPFDHTISMDGHLQSHWLAVRRSMFTSADWATYWGEMPMITSYRASVTEHESRFTGYFEQRGHRHAVAFPASDYDTSHPVMNNIVEMLHDGCPIVKRRTFFHNPMYNEHFAIDGRRVSQAMEALGYPMDMLFANLARTSKPRALVTNLGLLEVLPEVDLGYDRDKPLRVVAVAHIFYPDMTDEIVDRFDFLPGDYDLVVTTSDDDKRDEISKVLAARGRPADVRVVGSNRGRDISAFLIECRDVIESDDYDLVVKLHSKKNVQDSANIGELFKRHLFEGLLASPGYAANVLRLFQQQPTLGMVFPPAVPHRLPDARPLVVPQQGPGGGGGGQAGHPGAVRRHDAPLAERQHVHRPSGDAAPPRCGRLLVRGLPRRVGVRRRGAQPRPRAPDELLGAQHRAPRPRGHGCRPHGDQLQVPGVPRHLHRRAAAGVPQRADPQDQAPQAVQGPWPAAGRREVRHGSAGPARPAQAGVARVSAGTATEATRFPTVASEFDSRANSIGFFRWLLAFSVIFSHAGPLAGFYGQEDLGVQISDEQSLGGVAVAGFFFFSGFLITRSRRSSGLVRYFWRRCLRIMPAFWTALLLTAFVLAPIAWVREKGSIAGFWSADVDSPFTYFFQNMFLVLDQRNIAGMGESVPYAKLGGYDWNGSAWTLQLRVQGLHPRRCHRHPRPGRQPLGGDRVRRGDHRRQRAALVGGREPRSTGSPAWPRSAAASSWPTPTT